MTDRYLVEIPLYSGSGGCYGTRLLFAGSLDDCMKFSGSDRRISDEAGNPLYFYDDDSGAWEPADETPSDNDTATC